VVQKLMVFKGMIVGDLTNGVSMVKI
jgi:hypothetical protein